MNALQRDVLTLLRLLRPHDAVGYEKLRVGSPHDGGYVLLDDLAGLQAVVGCGVGHDVRFELELANRGIDVDLFDHTVAGAPQGHPRFRFHKVRVTTQVELQAPSISLEGIARMRALSDDAAMLKMDIEGDEWALLAETGRAAFRPYRQIVIELHWFDRLGDRSVREVVLTGVRNLTRDFAVVHVHANNHAPMLSFGGFLAPCVLEATLVKRSRYRLRPSEEEFPTPLDTPNNPNKPDMWLGKFDFPHPLTQSLRRRLRSKTREAIS